MNRPIRGLLAGAVALLPACFCSAQITIVPAAQRTAVGNTTTPIPLASTPTRYQQVFLGSEMPPAQLVRCIAFRQDLSPGAGKTIDVEMSLGYTTFDPATLTATFAANQNSGSMTNVVRRKSLQLPNLVGQNYDPSLFVVQFAADVPWMFTQQAGRNVLLDITVHGNSQNNTTFPYQLDAANGTTTTRVFGGATLTTGTINRNYGLVVAFSSVCPKIATYDTFGQGCKGSGGHTGHIVPPLARTQFLNSGNAWTLGAANQHWQQQVEAAAMPSVPARFISLAFREDNLARSVAPQTLTLKIQFGLTSHTSASLTGTYASNMTDPMTVVFNGNVSLPAVSSVNTDAGKFDYLIPLSTQYLYTPATGKNFLIDIENTTASAVARYPDAEASASAMGSRVFANPWNAVTGTVGRDHCMAMCFGTAGFGNAIPELAAPGRPVINKPFDVTLAAARANSAAVLVLGVSNTSWGAFSLPLDLTPIGAAGCQLLASLDLGIAIPTSPLGMGKVTIPIPNDATLAGGKFYNQYIVVDPAANSLQLAFTNGGAAVIGEQ